MREMERVLHVVGNLDYHRGFMRESRASLVITDERMIVAFLTTELAKEMKKQAGGGIKGFIGGVAKTYGHWNEYYEMSPEDILKESPENFEIPLREVREVRIKSGDSEFGKRGELEVKAGKGYKFYEGDAPIHVRELKKTLESLGIKVKAPRFAFF